MVCVRTREGDDARRMLKQRCRRLNEQTIDITDASSGIDLAPARRAAQAGAKVALASRIEETLRRVCDKIRHRTDSATLDGGDEGQGLIT